MPKPVTSEKIALGAGCFWGTEAYFKLIPGVLDTEVGYCGGKTDNPNYREICEGNTNHAESLLITFDPQIISVSDLLKHFWRMHDPTSFNRQGNDVGSQYRSIIFYTTPEQQKIAEEQKAKLQATSPKKIVTQIEPLPTFFPAESYHQDYLTKNPDGYCHVNLGLAAQKLE